MTALRGWLAERIADAEREDGEEERARRLESDAEAVQVLTIHRSKGLEFPVVYCPFLWDPSWIREQEPVSFHDPATGDRRTVDVGLGGRDFERHFEQHEIEERGEDLRLAYVALTRAKHQAVIWWAGSRDSRNSPLGRLLFAKDADGNVRPYGSSTPTDAAVGRAVRGAGRGRARADRVERSTLAACRRRGARRSTAPAELAAARFDRHLDLRWRRTSYSDITAEAHDPLVASEPERPVLSDEPEAPTPVAVARGDRRAPSSSVTRRSAAMPVGVEFGTFVHTVLEATDFAAADLDAELAERVAAAQSRRALDLGDRTRSSRAAGGDRDAARAALGGLRLRDVARADRLDELEFELPLAGGDDPTGRLTLDAIAARAARAPAGRRSAGRVRRAPRGPGAAAAACAASSPAASTS